MKYGYFNQFITGIGEDVEGEIALISQHADQVMVDTLSDRPCFDEMVGKATQGDAIVVYSMTRSFSGLADVAEEISKLYAKGVSVTSLTDKFTMDHTEGGRIAYETMMLASTLVGVDPNHGFYR
nr:recombinase family protein [uncultured Holophaga sp.]